MSWFNKWGTVNLFGPGEEQDNDNPLLFTGYLKALGGFQKPERLFDPSVYFKEPGLLIRSPDRPDASNSWDEDLGMCYLCVHCTESIYEYGKSHWWYFNTNPKLNKFSWSLVRQPSQQYVICKAAFKYAGVLRTVWFSAALVICAFHNPKTRSSELLAQWLANRVVIRGRCNFITHWLIDWMESRYDWASVFETYFSPSNPCHPIIALAHEYFQKTKP